MVINLHPNQALLTQAIAGLAQTLITQSPKAQQVEATSQSTIVGVLAAAKDISAVPGIGNLKLSSGQTLTELLEEAISVVHVGESALGLPQDSLQ